jgi:hypothetical protein
MDQQDEDRRGPQAFAADAADLFRHQGDLWRAGGLFRPTLVALVGDGTVLKASDGYRLAGDGSASKSEQTRVGTGIRVYCARCEDSHPSPDKASGETLEDVHRRAIAP